MNKIILYGKITEDPICTELENGIAFCTFKMAVERDGAKETDPKITDVFFVTATGAPAEVCRETYKADSQVKVFGCLTDSVMQDVDGTIKNIATIAANEVNEFVVREEGEGSDHPRSFGGRGDRRGFRGGRRDGGSDRGGFRGGHRDGGSDRGGFRSHRDGDSDRGGFRGHRDGDSDRGGFRGRRDGDSDRGDFRGRRDGDSDRGFRGRRDGDSDRGFRGRRDDDSSSEKKTFGRVHVSEPDFKSKKDDEE